MAAESLQLVPVGSLTGKRVDYLVSYSGTQRIKAGIRYALGTMAGYPVAVKTMAPAPSVLTAGAAPGQSLLREVQVGECLRGRGGERLAACLASDVPNEPSLTLTASRGVPLSVLVQDEARWPLPHPQREKAMRDLVQGLEVLRLSGLVHGAIGLDTLYWDGSTLQITDFSHASFQGRYLDGSEAHHSEDIIAAARVIYHLCIGQSLPADPAELRDQVERDPTLGGTERGRAQGGLLLHQLPAHGRDEYYAFSADPDLRPTSQTLLAWLNRPHGRQPADLAEQEQRDRARFRALRERQARARVAYFAWDRQRRTAVPRLLRPVQPARNRPQPGVPAVPGLNHRSNHSPGAGTAPGGTSTGWLARLPGTRTVALTAVWLLLGIVLLLALALLGAL
jgi:hypothetical protein